MTSADESDEIREYWRSLEAEVGETVEWYSIGELLEPFDGFKKYTVGMFFLTPTFLYFQTFPRTDFLRTLANSFRKKKKEGEKFQRGYPRNEIILAETRRPRGIARLTSASMPKILIRFLPGGGEEKVLSFQLLDKKRGDELIVLLRSPSEIKKDNPASAGPEGATEGNIDGAGI